MLQKPDPGDELMRRGSYPAWGYSGHCNVMSALPPKADIGSANTNVRYGP